MSHADMNNCCGFNEAAASFSWNSPKKAINPYLDPVEVAPVSTLSNLITLYAADTASVQQAVPVRSASCLISPGRSLWIAGTRAGQKASNAR